MNTYTHVIPSDVLPKKFFFANCTILLVNDARTDSQFHVSTTYSMWIEFLEISIILLKLCTTCPYFCWTLIWVGIVLKIFSYVWQKINDCLSLFSSNCFVTLSSLISADNHFPELFRNIFWSWKHSFISHAIRSHIT